MAKVTMGVYVIEYDTKKTNWKANIVANNSDEAIKFLRTNVKGITNINSLTMMYRVDAITSEILNKLAKVQTLEVEKEVIKEVEKIVEKVVLACPYCNQEFETKKGLKGHITKIHKAKIRGLNV